MKHLIKTLTVICLSVIFSMNIFSDEKTITLNHCIEYHPVISEFRSLINNDPVVRMYLNEMINQVPEERRDIKNIDDFLFKLNKILTTAPEYSPEIISICPISKILVKTMSTQAGFAVYTSKTINSMLKKILNTWSKFLDSPDSLYVINESSKGWKSEAAKKRLNMNDYIYDPEDKYWGFKSWNNFFTRKLAPGVRPIAEPENSKIIVSACDSVTYRIRHNVKKQDTFWIKKQPYSLMDMLANDEYVEQFIGGSVYQAFLNLFNYHRWHSPISGTIKKAYVVNGLYFSKTNMISTDNKGQYKSQAYIAHVQTRALIFIEADDPLIGLMCFIPIGMVEISSCMIDPKIQPGYHVKKGEELGYFQFGGSTNCLVFRQGVIKKFTTKRKKFCKVGEPIAIVN